MNSSLRYFRTALTTTFAGFLFLGGCQSYIEPLPQSTQRTLQQSPTFWEGLDDRGKQKFVREMRALRATANFRTLEIYQPGIEYYTSYQGYFVGGPIAGDQQITGHYYQRDAYGAIIAPYQVVWVSGEEGKLYCYAYYYEGHPNSDYKWYLSFIDTPFTTPSPSPIPTTTPDLNLVSSPFFSPNNDGIEDTSTIEITADGPWELHLGDQGIVATGIGNSTIQWDGALNRETANKKFAFYGYFNLRLISGTKEITAPISINSMKGFSPGISTYQQALSSLPKKPTYHTANILYNAEYWAGLIFHFGHMIESGVESGMIPDPNTFTKEVVIIPLEKAASARRVFTALAPVLAQSYEDPADVKSNRRKNRDFNLVKNTSTGNQNTDFNIVVDFSNFFPAPAVLIPQKFIAKGKFSGSYRVFTFPEGSSLVARTFSRSDAPTLEVQPSPELKTLLDVMLNANLGSLKIRYKD